MTTRHEARMKNISHSILKENEQFPEEDDYTLKDMLHYDPPTPWWWLIYEWRNGITRPSKGVLGYWIGISVYVIVMSIVGLLLFTDNEFGSDLVSSHASEIRCFFIANMTISLICISSMLYILHTKKCTRPR